MAATSLRMALALVTLIVIAIPAASMSAGAWGNGDQNSVQFKNFGIHDMTVEIATRDMGVLAPSTFGWALDWYLHNTTDWGLSFDEANTGPVVGDNILSYTDDPDSHYQDWDNHTLYLHPRSGWDPPDGDAARRVHTLYNLTKDQLYWWMLNGSRRYDVNEHYAAYYAGLMSHYLMDVTQFGHTDWTDLDHSHPAYDPQGATYHSYYEARVWSDSALQRLRVDLMALPLPQLRRVDDPGQLVRDLATFVNGRHGPAVQFVDTGPTTVTLGSTYVRMLESFTSNWDAGVEHNGMRGYDEELYNLTLGNLEAGIDNLTSLWYSVYLDAREMFLRDAPDILITNVLVDPAEGAYDGLGVAVEAFVSNNGNLTSGPFSVSLFVDDVEVDSAQADMGPGVGGVLDLCWTAEAGSHDLRVAADAYHDVAESNELNNVWSLTYNVSAEHHASRLTAEPEVLQLLQDDTGAFNLTLENLGNRGDVFDISIEASPGTLDFSLTLHNETVSVPASGSAGFTIDIGTRLDNDVGWRNFTVVATGGNSTASVNLSLFIDERQVAPFIVVEYPFYGNVSVPVRFNASGTWDHNGDAITFEWDFGDGSKAEGAVVEHVYDEVGDYLIQLFASDGQLVRHETLEVSVENAIPPKPFLGLKESDLGVAIVGWFPWNNSRYFNTYRLYVSTDPNNTVKPKNLAELIGGLYYIDHASLPVSWEAVSYIVLEVENIYHDRWYSEPLVVRPEPRLARSYTGPLATNWTHVYNITNDGFELTWREWSPILEEGSYQLKITGWSRIVSFPTIDVASVDIEDISITEHRFSGLGADFDYYFDYYIVSVFYVGDDGERWLADDRAYRLLDNLPPVATLTVESGPITDRSWTIFIEVSDPDNDYVTVVIDWGDGTPNETRGVRLLKEKMTIEVSHIYESAGLVNLTILAKDNLTGESEIVREYNVVEEDEDGLFVILIAIGLILLIAILGYIAGHLTGYFRMGSEGREEEPKGEAPEGDEASDPEVDELIAQVTGEEEPPGKRG